MKSDPSIAIVIPSYNSRETIIECLNSLLNQSYRNIEEVMAVDFSVDGIDKIGHANPDIKTIDFFY